MIMQAPHVQQEDNLRKAILISVAAHVAVLAVFIVRMVVFPSEPLKLDDAIRVDIVALPDKGPKVPPLPIVDPQPVPPAPQPPEPITKPEPIKPEPAPAPVPVAKPIKPDSPKVVLKPDPKKTKKAQDDAMKRLAALEKIERMTKSQSAPRPAPVKGNQISHGGSLTGVIRLEQQGYLESVHSVVQARWNLPSFLASANLKARVRIFVDGKGTVIKRSITQSSGNDIFDARLLAAIDASSPLQPPPESLVGILENDGLELGFEP
jgi:TonB family protein